MAAESKIKRRKITLSLPADLAEQLDATVPRGQRGDFIAAAIADKLTLVEQAATVDESAGIWTDNAYPELASEQDIDAWLTTLRSSWNTGESRNTWFASTFATGRTLIQLCLESLASTGPVMRDRAEFFV